MIYSKQYSRNKAHKLANKHLLGTTAIAIQKTSQKHEFEFLNSSYCQTRIKTCEPICAQQYHEMLIKQRQLHNSLDTF
jgi:hypothetical protein